MTFRLWSDKTQAEKRNVNVKKIFVSASVIIILAIVAVIFSETSPANPGYYLHEDDSTHYDETTLDYHAHADGETLI